MSLFIHTHVFSTQWLSMEQKRRCHSAWQPQLPSFSIQWKHETIICFCVPWKQKKSEWWQNCTSVIIQVISWSTACVIYIYQNSFWTDLINEYLLEKTTKAPSQPTLPGPPPPPPEEQDIQPADPPPRSRRSAPVLVSRGAAPHTSLSSVKGKPTVSVVVLSVAIAGVTIIIFHAFLKPLRNSSPHNFYSPLSELPGFHKLRFKGGKIRFFGVVFLVKFAFQGLNIMSFVVASTAGMKNS